MVNINSSDIVDGKPTVILGLIWTLILNFEVRLSVTSLMHYCTVTTTTFNFVYPAYFPGVITKPNQTKFIKSRRTNGH